MTWRAESNVTPGISLLPRLRGPMPDRNNRFPTRLACGNAPTGSGARVLSNVLLIFSLSKYGLNPAPIFDYQTTLSNHTLSQLAARRFSRGGRSGIFVRSLEALYRRQDCLERRAVDVPHGQKQPTDYWSDNESDWPEK